MVFTLTFGLLPAAALCFKVSFVWLISPILLKYIVSIFKGIPVKIKNVPWHILAPSAVACDIIPLRAGAPPPEGFCDIGNEVSYIIKTRNAYVPGKYLQKMSFLIRTIPSVLEFLTGGHQISRLSGSWTIPSVGTFTLPQRLPYSIIRIR